MNRANKNVDSYRDAKINFLSKALSLRYAKLSHKKLCACLPVGRALRLCEKFSVLGAKTALC